jgi:hypothetical protein
MSVHDVIMPLNFHWQRSRGTKWIARNIIEGERGLEDTKWDEVIFMVIALFIRGDQV